MTQKRKDVPEGKYCGNCKKKKSIVALTPIFKHTIKCIKYNAILLQEKWYKYNTFDIPYLKCSQCLKENK